jgi:hypothetical protein
LAVGCWLLAVGCWLLAVGCWLWVGFWGQWESCATGPARGRMRGQRTR